MIGTAMQRTNRSTSWKLSRVTVSPASVAVGDFKSMRSTVGSMESKEMSHTNRLEVAVTMFCDFKRSSLETKIADSSSTMWSLSL